MNSTTTMEATEIKINAKQAAAEIISSNELRIKGFKRLDEHLATCTVIRNLFGEQAYKVIAEIVEEYFNPTLEH